MPEGIERRSRFGGFERTGYEITYPCDLSGLLRFRPDNGMQIIARGRVTIYDQRGELQLAAEFLEPLGAGALQLAFEQLKNKLAQEGLFDRARKKPVPQLPRRIGISLAW